MKWKEFKDIGMFCEDWDLEIVWLVLLLFILVYRDICSGYRIRFSTEKELFMKVSKDVFKMCVFEMGLFEYYKLYVKMLVRCFGVKKFCV